MTTYRAQIELQMTSGNPADVAVNTLYFDDSGGAGDPADIEQNVVDFYNALRSRFSSSVATGGHGLKVYDLADPQPRIPIIDTTWTLLAVPAGNPMPHQVSVCISFQGPRVSGVNQASQRGRIYVGPLNEGCVDSTGRVSSAVQTQFTGAAADLGTDSIADSLPWVVWSPTLQVASVIDNGWVDDTFDIQRRRQRTTLGRTTFTV